MAHGRLPACRGGRALGADAEGNSDRRLPESAAEARVRNGTSNSVDTRSPSAQRLPVIPTDFGRHGGSRNLLHTLRGVGGGGRATKCQLLCCQGAGP
ncbi:hypothetical protein chiPu_0022053 [Chiloscyllium punctatum]|uniref:Uncharacterized protein n=1 Tax=Chiloscyllium punctatum TaxID=137246 RepID=A0A401RIU2_CHIPU|nr:hypothetical protein [Chiloscyllium punctatum]